MRLPAPLPSLLPRLLPILLFILATHPLRRPSRAAQGHFTPFSLRWRAPLVSGSLFAPNGWRWLAIVASLSPEPREFAMEVDFRYPSVDINTVYLSSYLGKGEVAGHRCDRSCQVQHVWANLYRCTTSGSSHVCDQNCNQRIIYDNHSTLCRVSGRIFPLTPSEQEAIRGVRRKRDAESSDSSPLKRCRDMIKNAASFEIPFRQRVLPISTFMDIN